MVPLVSMESVTSHADANWALIAIHDHLKKTTAHVYTKEEFVDGTKFGQVIVRLVDVVKAR